MNISDFTYLLQNPANINASQTEAIAAIIKEFPYFQSARIVHLKGLKNKDSFTYNAHLKIAAAHTTDRSILFDFITSKIFQQHAISNSIKELDNNINDIEVEVTEVVINPSIRMENAIKTKIQEANAILDPQLFQPKKEKILNPEPIIEKPTPEEQLEIGKPFSFDKNERHSFSEWLQLTNFQPIVREEEVKKKEVEKNKRFDLINKFIDSNPKIVPKETTDKTINLAKEITVDQSMLMTETLAKVYLEQKKYKKAIKAYNILILKYPEKSGFFADQIRAVKKLQQNNK